MAFTTDFLACNDADRVEEQLNPFTGGALTMRGGAVTGAQRAAIDKLLKSVDAFELDGGAFSVEFSDEGTATVWFSGYHDNEVRGGTITVRNLSPELSSCIHRLLLSGHLALNPEARFNRLGLWAAPHATYGGGQLPDGAEPIVASQQIARDVAGRWPNASVAASAGELHELLTAMAAKAEEMRKPWWRFW